MSTVGHAGERALIDRLRAIAGHPPAWVRLGIGDDAAIIEPVRGELTVLTTDSLVEDVHFRRAWMTPHEIGAKAIAVNLSDLAAMGATPRATLVSLALPPALPLEEFDGLCHGIRELTHASGAAWVGGNITRSPGPLMVDVTVVGSVHRRKHLRRSGARAGDELYVTGPLGLAAAGLTLLERGLDETGVDQNGECIARYKRPTARVRIGCGVARTRSATAAMDLSDGLADAARQIAEASGTGVEIDLPAVPSHPAVLALADRLGRPVWQWSLVGGEDYELLFAVAGRRQRAFAAAVSQAGGAPPVRVGRLTKRPDFSVREPDRTWPLPAGFTHFGLESGK